MGKRTTHMDEIPAPASVKGTAAAGGAAGPSLESWRTQPDTATPTPHDQALREVLADAKALGIEIRTGEEAEAYLNFAAKQHGIPPEAMHAVTLGDDLIMVREAQATDVRTLREELIHTQQQKQGMEISAESVTRGEVEARELLLQNANRWGLSEDERAEVREDLRKIEERGGY